jgi:hypothetical protein
VLGAHCYWGVIASSPPQQTATHIHMYIYMHTCIHACSHVDIFICICIERLNLHVLSNTAEVIQVFSSLYECPPALGVRNLPPIIPTITSFLSSCHSTLCALSDLTLLGHCVPHLSGARTDLLSIVSLLLETVNIHHTTLSPQRSGPSSFPHCLSLVALSASPGSVGRGRTLPINLCSSDIGWCHLCRCLSSTLLPSPLKRMPHRLHFLKVCLFPAVLPQAPLPAML